MARLVAEGLTKSLNKTFIVEAKPGGAGIIAANTLISARPDGQTLLLVQRGIVSETPLALKTSFDPFTALKPLVQVSQSGLVLVGNPNLPANTLAELVEYVKSKPNEIDYASYASGMRAHTLGVLFNRLAGLDMAHVGYKGSPPALQDVMGGHIPLAFDGTATSTPHVLSGRLKAYAVAYPSRLTDLPDVPTFAELGYPEMSAPSWMGIWVTPNMPDELQAEIRQAIETVVMAPAYTEKLASLGLDQPLPLSSEELMTDARESYNEQADLLKSIDFVLR